MATPKYLEIARQAFREIRETQSSEKSELSEKREEGEGGLISLNSLNSHPEALQNRLDRLDRAFTALEARCPNHVSVMRWQHAVEDGRRFLGAWGKQAEALGWTPADLFGLHQPPEHPHPNYSRLSRFDCMGLIWILQGRRVVALTELTAAIETPTGNITTYRRFNKPPLGRWAIRPRI